MAAVLVSLLLAQSIAGEPRAVKQRYLHDLRGVSCSISEPGGAALSSLKFGQGAATKLPPEALVVVGAGAIDQAGEPWVKVKPVRAPAQTGWIDLKYLSCV